MKRVVIIVIIVLYVVLSAGFIYFENINLVPAYANRLKFSTIVLSALTAAFLWRYSIGKFDATVLVICMALTVATDVLLVFYASTHNVQGMLMYCIIKSIYFMRYQYDKENRTLNWHRALVLPCFLIIPLTLLFLSRREGFFLYGHQYSTLIIVTSYYIQALLAVIIFAVKSVRSGRYPRANGLLILMGLGLFVIADVIVVLAQPADFIGLHDPIFIRMIWLFYTPSQALLAFSSYDFGGKLQPSAVR